MATTMLDRVWDNFALCKEMLELTEEELEELNSRIDTRIHSLIMGIRDTQRERNQMFKEEMEEEKQEIEEDV